MKSNEYITITLKSSLKYKIRRYFQKIAYKIMGPENMTKVYFRILLGYNLNLTHPETFNEKICFYKLFYCPQNELVIKCADKYEVRNYLKSKGYENNLINVVGVWDEANSINWNELPEKFALKRTNGCGYNIICLDKSKIEEKEVKKLLNKWQKDKFGMYNVEPHYDKMPSKIVCEEYIDSDGRLPVDYKIHCFNGQAKFIMVCDGRVRGYTTFYYYDLNKQPLLFSSENADRPLEIDDTLFKEMINMSNNIAKDFPFVRVDFYIHKGKLIIGELTFTPTAGYDYTIAKEGDYAIGQMFEIGNWREK